MTITTSARPAARSSRPAGAAVAEPARPGRPGRKSPLRAATLGGATGAAGPGLTTAEILAARSAPPEAVPAPQLRRMQISEFTIWLRSRTNKHHRPFQADTIAAYADAARALSDWMREQDIDGDFTFCDTGILNRFFAGYLASHGQGGTNTRQRNLRHLFTWLEETCGHPHPWTAALHRYAPAQKRPSTLAQEFIADLLEVTGGGRGRSFEQVRGHAMIRVLTEGVRRTELIQLQTTDLSTDLIAQPFVRVVPLKGGRAYTEGRIVPLAAATARAVVAYLRVRRSHRLAGTPALWLGTRNRGPMTGAGLYQMLLRRAEQAGYDPAVHPHQFRHSFAHDWQGRGVASDATFRDRRKDDGAGDPAGGLSQPLTAYTRETADQRGSARTRLQQMQRRCIQFRCVRYKHVASRSTSKRQRRGQMRHLAAGRAEVFSVVGNPLPTSFDGGGAEGDLMRLMGWTDRSMLDRYGADLQVQRAIDAKRRRGDLY